MKILLSLFIFSAPLCAEPRFGYEPIDDPGETLRQRRESNRKDIQEQLAKLKKASFGIPLNDDQKKVFLNCLAEDRSACNELLTYMREKYAQDLDTIKEAAHNGRLLAEIINDTSVVDDVKNELLISLQRKAINYFNKLNELMPAYLHLYRFLCNLPYHNEDVYPSSYSYVFISRKQNDSLIYEEVSSESALVKELEDNYSKNFKTIEFFKIPKFLKQISSSKSCLYYEPWQNLVIPVWDGKIKKLSSADQTDVQMICARSGVFSKVLLFLYYKHTNNFIEELSRLDDLMSVN